jgi:hypothetical protein
MKEALHVILPVEHSPQYLAPKYYRNEYYFFNLSGGRKKIKVLLSDILLVRAIKGANADKLLYLKGSMLHLVRGHTMEEFISITGFLLQCNKQDLVSPEAINYVEDDTIYLNDVTDNGKPIFIILNRTFKKAFWGFFNLRK